MIYNCKTEGCDNTGEADSIDEIARFKKLCGECRRKSLVRKKPQKLKKQKKITKFKCLKCGSIQTFHTQFCFTKDTTEMIVSDGIEYPKTCAGRIVKL